MTASRLTTRPTPRLMLSSGLTGKEVGIASIAMIFRSGSWVKRPPGAIAGGSNGTRRELNFLRDSYLANYTRRSLGGADPLRARMFGQDAPGILKTMKPADLSKFYR